MDIQNSKIPLLKKLYTKTSIKTWFLSLEKSFHSIYVGFAVRTLNKMTIPFPNDIMIEVTNVCNLKCTTCYSHQDGREKRFMSLDVFKKIVDNIPSPEDKTMSLYNSPNFFPSGTLKISQTSVAHWVVARLRAEKAVF